MKPAEQIGSGCKAFDAGFRGFTQSIQPKTGTLLRNRPQPLLLQSFQFQRT